MAVRGIAIQDVDNILDGQDIVGTEKLPVSSGQTEPQVVTTGELREYINEEPNSRLSQIDVRLNGIGTITNLDIDAILNT